MSRSGEFCPRCGDTLAREREEGVLCDACYLDQYDLVEAPDRVEIGVCSGCGAVHRGNRWVDVGAEDYTDVAVDAVTEALGVHVDAESVSWQVAPEQVDATTVRMHCSFSGVLRDRPVTEEVVVPVKIGRETCDRCGDIAGGAFAAVVQVRASDRTPAQGELDRALEIAHDYVTDREASGDRGAYITEVGEVDAGLNLKVSTTQVGRAIADRIVRDLGGEVSDSRRLVTEDGDGRRVYRMTYAVRLPRYRPDEVIDPADGGGPVLVRSVTGNLKGARLESGESFEAPADGGMPDARRLGWRGDAEETALVAVEDDHAVQVLDPETYEAKTIARPDYLDADADTVPVLKSRAGVHVLPRDGDGAPGEHDGAE
ncbi:MAG: 60S ribosomal export protein NMD3 [Salinirussus sp.]